MSKYASYIYNNIILDTALISFNAVLVINDNVSIKIMH